VQRIGTALFDNLCSTELEVLLKKIVTKKRKNLER